MFAREWQEFDALNAKLRDNIRCMAKEKKDLLSEDQEVRKSAKTKIEGLCHESCRIFTYLKALRQKSLDRREAFQSELSNLCKNVDHQALGVKNFEYEQVDTMKQIAICDAYQSHPDEPALVSKEVFYEKNPQPPMTNPHKEKTRRLQFELQQRKEFVHPCIHPLIS